MPLKNQPHILERQHANTGLWAHVSNHSSLNAAKHRARNVTGYYCHQRFRIRVHLTVVATGQHDAGRMRWEQANEILK